MHVLHHLKLRGSRSPAGEDRLRRQESEYNCSPCLALVYRGFHAGALVCRFDRDEETRLQGARSSVSGRAATPACIFSPDLSQYTTALLPNSASSHRLLVSHLKTKSEDVITWRNGKNFKINDGIKGFSLRTSPHFTPKAEKDVTQGD